MTSFEDRLLTSLSAEDEAFLKDLEGDRGLFDQMGATYTGPLKVWAVLVTIFTFIFFGLAVWSIYTILKTESMNEIAIWLGVFVFSVLSVGLLKMWLLMRMNHLAVLRELKRIELRLVKGA